MKGRSRAVFYAARGGASAIEHRFSRVKDGASSFGRSGAGRFVRTAEVPSRYVTSPTKRILDIVFAAAALVALAPLMVAIAGIISLTSEGPVLFRQKRTGLGGRAFDILKFRSMLVDREGETEVVQAVRGDSRVTPFGRVLRRTSLDELPQLINVLRGEMSVVGPRPHAVAHDAAFARQAPNYPARFTARPGITGLAQVSGARGLTPSQESVVTRTELDLNYVDNASVALDARIIVKTVKEVLRSDAAF